MNEPQTPRVPFTCQGCLMMIASACITIACAVLVGLLLAGKLLP